MANKIMAAVTLSIVLVMGVEILFRFYFGTRDRLVLMETMNADLVASTYSGIRYPMSVGDSAAVERVLADVRLKMEGVEVFICDDGQQIIWSTHTEKIHTIMEDSIASAALLNALRETLQTGELSRASFEDELEGERYLVTIRPILNDKDCFHCHGSAKKIIGGMVIRTNAEVTLKAVAAARDRTIVITIFGIAAIIILINLLIGKFVRRPVTRLADNAKKFADGDMSVVVEVTTNDEIGLLANTFNYMVMRIASFSKKLEQEVEKKTILLNERNMLIGCLDRANKQLRDLDLLKSKFLANMSHELRTPMNSVIGYTDLLLDGVDGPISEEQRNSLQRITTNARHLLNLINDILDLARIEAGKAELDVRGFSLRELAISIRPIFEPLVAQKGLSLNVECPEDMPVVYGDMDKMRQVLVNLVGNAIKFTETGHVIVRCGISRRGVKPGEPPIFAEVCVEDTGIGIKEGDLAKVFDKFVQADLSTVRQYEGTGLGLSIAKQLVAMHKGVIWATSQYGKGSRFYVLIPLRADMLACPSKPVVELAMADGLATACNVPAERFLQHPQLGGKPTTCWEYIHCGETGCPAYGSDETRCWLILGTHCKGIGIAAYPEKAKCCRGCEVIWTLVLGGPVSSEG
ncbi:MAG: hypothetical protein A2521_05615 [Deltaproteobacteria bacterium RIFOXYD12_FULL_57_12]|nr:MAG: hypothetical protein A2521_05615 [Deltaproteobacteria bacterium RIFOXYD12_FULL_57_12]